MKHKKLNKSLAHHRNQRIHTHCPKICKLNLRIETGRNGSKIPLNLLHKWQTEIQIFWGQCWKRVQKDLSASCKVSLLQKKLIFVEFVLHSVKIFTKSVNNGIKVAEFRNTWNSWFCESSSLRLVKIIRQHILFYILD